MSGPSASGTIGAGMSPAKKPTPTTKPRIPSPLRLDTSTPQLKATVGTGFPAASPSPVTREESPGQSPISASGAAPTVLLGAIPRYAVKDQNTLSSTEFVAHKNIEGIFDILQGYGSTIERLAEHNKYRAQTGPKIGTYTAEESQLSSDLLEKYRELIKDVINAFGQELKTRTPIEQITGNVGEKLNRQADEFIVALVRASPNDVSSDPVDDNAANDTSGLEQLVAQFSETGKRVFYQSMVKLFVPNEKPKKGRSKTATASAAANTALDPVVEATIASLTTAPKLSVLQDRYNAYMQDKTSYSLKGKIIEQAKPFIDDWQQALDDEDDMDVDEGVEDLRKGILSDLSTLGDNDLVHVWKILGGKEQAGISPTASKGRGGARGGRGAAAGSKRKATARKTALDDDSDGDSDIDLEPPTKKKAAPKKASSSKAK